VSETRRAGEVPAELEALLPDAARLAAYLDVVELFAVGWFRDEPRDSLPPQFLVPCLPKADMAAVLSGGPRPPEDWVVCPVVAGFNSDAEKQKVLELLAAEVHGRGLFPLAAAMVAEAWSARCTPEEYAKDPRQPGERPDRQEVVVAVALAAGGAHAAMSTAPLVRGPNGLVRGLAFDPGGRTTDCDANLLYKFFRAYLRRSCLTQGRGLN
jgi:hypothetical protein